MRSESGQSTVEFAGTILWLVLAALFAWQLALVGWTAVSAGDAARTAARLHSRGADDTTAAAAGRGSLSGKGLAGGATVTTQGDSWSVRVPIPLVLPGLHPLHLAITETATMPETG